MTVNLPTPGTPDRDLRLALAFEGGISLAVWMGGVSHEIDNLRLATAASTDPVLTAWRRILTMGGYRKAVVDVIAGTSAGGLNGTLLATAIARGRTTRDTAMRDLWRTAADLSPGALIATQPDTRNGLLNSGFFTEKLQKALPSPVPGTEAARREVTLLVTATVVGATVSAAEASADGYDSRRRYRFRYRHAVAEAPEVDDFAADAPLLTAAQASASFPVAFSAIPETQELARLAQPPRVERAGFLVDGGVLDNLPLEPLLDELRSRPTDAAFDRYVVTVSAGVNRGRPGMTAVPTWPQVLGAVLNASREPDDRLDREALRETRKAAQYWATDPWRVLAGVLTTQVATDTRLLTYEQLGVAAEALFQQYRWSRQQAMDVQNGVVPPAQASGAGRAWTPPGPRIPTTIEAVTEGRWLWGAGGADRYLRWWGRILSARSFAGGADRDTAFAGLATAQRRVTYQLDQITELQRAQSGPAVIGAQLAAAFESRATLLASIMSQAAADVAPCFPGVTAEQLLLASVRLDIVTSAMSWAQDAPSEAPQFTLSVIGPDAPVPAALSTTLITGFDATQLQQSAQQLATTKLIGERWGHFGAFALEAGRVNDWRWGRIDGAVTLARAILRDHLDDGGPALIDALVAAILVDEGTSAQEFADDARTLANLDAKGLWRAYRATQRADLAPHRALVEQTVAELAQNSTGVWRAALDPQWRPQGTMARIKAVGVRFAGRLGRRVLWQKLLQRGPE